MKDAVSFVFTSLLALHLLAADAIAAEKLQVDLTPLGLRARNAAPIPVEARFVWESTRILEGRLDLEFREGNRVLGRYRSGDLALTGGTQSFRMLLPPALAPFSDAQVEVQMKFVSAGGTIELEPSIFSLPTEVERSLVVGWCDAATTGGEVSAELARDLRLEHFAPPADSVAQRLLTTSVVRLTPEDLPAQPLAYTAFDVVVLTKEAFKEAGEHQLQALVRWVKGGGSVCVFAGEGLQAIQLDCLNQLAESPSGSPAFLSDSAGNLLPEPKNILCLHSGVGRTVIVPGRDEADPGTNAPEWRTAATFLWKMRSGQARSIGVSGFWELPEVPLAENFPAMRGQRFSLRSVPQYREPASYAVRPTDLGAQLMSRLMPQTVRLIPFSALIGIMVLFVLMIGPGDYFVLGLLRRRRLTWLLFPATSLAFTVATVLMANHYLGLRDQRRSLIVVDLAGDGTALRWNRYELVFAARDKQAVTDLKDALWASLDARAVPDRFYNPNNRPVNPYNQRFGYGAEAGRATGPPLYEGTLPAHFQISEAIRQWQPELNRVFSLEPPPVPLFQNWRAIEEAWPNLQKIRARLAEERFFGSDCCAITRSNSGTLSSGFPGMLPPAILGVLCAGNSDGLQSLVSQISPTGGGNFEDLPALGTETNDAALAIVTQTGDDIVVYRRFFYGN